MYNNCFGQKNWAGLNILTIPDALRLKVSNLMALKYFHGNFGNNLEISWKFFKYLYTY